MSSSHLFWTPSSLDVPAGVTLEEGHTGFLIHLPSAMRALIFLARRIQPFLSLVDREVEFCVLTKYNRSPLVWHLDFFLGSFREDKSQLPGFELTSQRVRGLRGYQLIYRGDRLKILKYGSRSHVRMGKHRKNWHTSPSTFCQNIPGKRILSSSGIPVSLSWKPLMMLLQSSIRLARSGFLVK